MRIINDEFFGDMTYDLEREEWKRIVPIQVPFNGKIYELDFFIEDEDPIITQTKYNLDDSIDMKMDEFSNDEIEEAEKNILEQREFYKKYLIDSKPIMKLIEDKIIEHFYEEREDLLEDEGYCIREFGEETTKRIREADTREKILSMVHFKDITLTTTQIRLIGNCEWYLDYERFGVSVRPNGKINVGSEEMIYY